MQLIWVELEETQDFVIESLDLSREEAGGTSFVPCAISVPPKPMFRCDTRCSDKAHSF